MADRPKTQKGSQAEDRRQRLAAALRENLGKRKAQARARAAAEKSQPGPDIDPGGKT
ncbi:MAG: hypothetical protein AB7O44_18390 [Hyphomicrobiaceae bacterium]|jgi:hypothetical protein